MIIELIVYGLATWRTASLFVNEAGPGNVFLHIRELAGIEHDDTGKVAIIPDGFFAGLLSCVWCASLWAGGFWVVLDWIFPEVAIRLGLILAVSAVAIFIQKVMDAVF